MLRNFSRLQCNSLPLGVHPIIHESHWLHQARPPVFCWPSEDLCLIVICIRVQRSLTSLHNVSAGQSTCVRKAPQQIYIFFLKPHHTFVFCFFLPLTLFQPLVGELSKLSRLWYSFRFLCAVVNMNISEEPQTGEHRV